MVIVVDSLAASGGYITAIAGDHIVAQQTSLVGSIGVLFQYPNFADLLDKIGVKVEAVKSTPLKAAPNGFEPTSPEAARGARCDRQGFLRLVQRPGEGSPPPDDSELRRWPTAASSPATRRSTSSSSTSSATSGRRSPGWPRRRTSMPSCRCATIELQQPLQRPAVPACRAVAVLDAVGLRAGAPPRRVGRGRRGGAFQP